MEKIKILMILDNLNKCDGIASYVMNYYKNMDLNKFQIDFLISKSDNGVCDEYRNIIYENGGKIILRHNITNRDILKEIKKAKQLFKQEKYDIIHSHIINMGYFYLKYARKNGVKIRILHSHTTFLYSKNIITYLRNIIFTKLAKKNANVNFACSELAGKSLFKNKEFKVINNAIDLEKYKFNKEIREKYRKEMNIQNNIVIGHIGRLNVQKNHKFLLDVFEAIYCEDNKYRLLLIGNGELENEIQNIIKQKRLENSVIMLGTRNDITNLLQAIDIFVLPSLFEGLPISGIEAQATGLQCYFSDKITKEVKIIDTTKFLEITDINIWKQNILETSNEINRSDILENIKESKFNIKKEAKKIEKIYIELINRS